MKPAGADVECGAAVCPRPWYRPLEAGEEGMEAAATETASWEVRRPVCSVCSGWAAVPKYILLGRPRNVRPAGGGEGKFPQPRYTRAAAAQRHGAILERRQPAGGGAGGPGLGHSPAWRACSETSALMSEKSHMARKLSKQVPSSASCKRERKGRKGGRRGFADRRTGIPGRKVCR